MCSFLFTFNLDIFPFLYLLKIHNPPLNLPKRQEISVFLDRLQTPGHHVTITMTPNSFASPCLSSQRLPLCLNFSSQFVSTTRACSHSYFVTDRLPSLAEWPHSGSSATLSQPCCLSRVFLWHVHRNCLRKVLAAYRLVPLGMDAPCLLMPSVSFICFYSISNFSHFLSDSSKYLKVGACLFFSLCLLVFSFLFCFKTRFHSAAQATLTWRFASVPQVLKLQAGTSTLSFSQSHFLMQVLYIRSFRKSPFLLRYMSQSSFVMF